MNRSELTKKQWADGKRKGGWKQSEETKKKIGEASKKWKHHIQSKENHWNWKGGISANVHSPNHPEYKKWRSDVFSRDNWTCQTCQARGVYLEAHHIKSWAKYPELRYILENGVALCKPCHALTDNYRGKKIK